MFLDKKRIVIKIGSSLLVERGVLRREWLENFAQNISHLHSKNIEIVIVTSGAIALGRSSIKPLGDKFSLSEKQAAASVGQIQLMYHYGEAFKKVKISVSQILLTAADCNARIRYLNSQNTITTLLKNKIIPIINENDSVAVDEIKIGDNDRLAARVAQMIGADLMILLSDIDGLYDKNPRTQKDAKFISEVKEITKEIEQMASGSSSDVGTGGMITKIKAAKMASLASCETIITNGILENCIENIFGAKQKFTIFRSEKTSAKSRKKWLSGFLNLKGEIIINDCAKEALSNKKISLLAIGIISTKGEFEKGDAVFIKDELGNHVASGISNYSNSSIKKILGKNSDEIKNIFSDSQKPEIVIHIDNMVII